MWKSHGSSSLGSALLLLGGHFYLKIINGANKYKHDPRNKHTYWLKMYWRSCKPRALVRKYEWEQKNRSIFRQACLWRWVIRFQQRYRWMMGARTYACMCVVACLCLREFYWVVVWPRGCMGGGSFAERLPSLLGNRGGRRQIFFSKGVPNPFLKSHKIIKPRLS